MDLILNARRLQVPDSHPQTTLLDWLREEGWTGAKEGCAEGECGACTVLLRRDHPAGSQYVPVNSCLLFLPMLAGQEVYTVEALAEGGRLSDAQAAMAKAGGSQCGYCTPGFVMSLFAEQYRPGRTGPCDPHAMAGNLCRCTGYRPIRDAALSLGPAPADQFRERLSQSAPPIDAFACSGFERPASLPEYLRIVAEQPEARPVAGATDLAVDANLRDRRWPLLVSVEALPELRVFEDAPDHVEIGASLTLSEIENRWIGAPQVVRDWFPLFASPLIRNRATLGGNLATASPIGDAAPLLLALNAHLKVAGKQGERSIGLDRFFKGYRKTALAAGELIVSILIPKPFPAQARFFKIAKRRMDDISTVAACFAVDMGEGGRITRVGVAYGGVAATPVRVGPVEEFLTGKPWNEATMKEAQQLIAAHLEPMNDHRGSAEYRLAMTQTLLEKFLVEQEELAVS
jgi:xanthine dehydrogenase small subunit